LRVGKFHLIALPLLLGVLGCGKSGEGVPSGGTGGGRDSAVGSGGSPGTGGATTTPGTGGAAGGQSGGAKGTSSATGTGGVIEDGGMSGTGGMGAGGNASGGITVSTGGKVGVTGGNTTSGTGGGQTGGNQGTGGTSSRGSGGNTIGLGGTSGTGGMTGVAVDSGAGGTSAGTGPCDIYEAASTPCVAAHSTVRALFGSYTGKLYQVRRADKTTKDISVLTTGGLADSASQEAFCAGTKCTISIIYDQSSQHNDLTLTKGGWIGDRAKEADAAGIKVTVAGHTVYGIHVPQSDGSTGVGYRNNKATGTAKGDEPESMYMVANGKLYNDQCCFDYGNAETNSLNNGKATMEAIYFGNCKSWGSGDGNGPWVMSDLEEGLFSGQSAKLNSADKSITSDYVTAMLKGKTHLWAIKSGDSQSGGLTKIYEGTYPSGYDPMKKEGAIVLGTGGDNSFMGVGDFFEGAMTAGYASDATDTAVQANIVAAGYGR